MTRMRGAALGLGTAMVAAIASCAMAHAPSPSAGPPMALRDGPLPPGMYLATPFDPAQGGHECFVPLQPGCRETNADDAIGFTFTIPSGWAGADLGIVLEEGRDAPPAGAGLAFGRGGWLHGDPCLTAAMLAQDDAPPDLGVGPTVDDLVEALVDHPLLEVTPPVDLTLAGYRGRSVDLRVPDIAGCDSYYPWEPGRYARGSGERWRIRAIDVDGVRVVITTFDHPETPAGRQAELQAIVDSISIDPRSALGAAPGEARPAIGATADDGARIVAVASTDERTRDLTIESPAVGVVEVRLLLPAVFDEQPATRWPVLLLLHGHAGHAGDWTDSTDVEALTAVTDLLVVMPDAADGWYADAWHRGIGGPPAWETFHLVELPQLLERNWRAGEARAVAGVSMGGMGAMSYAARHPGMFRAAASYSGVLDIIGADLLGTDAVFGSLEDNAEGWRSHNPLDLAPSLRGTRLYVSHGTGLPGPLDGPGAGPSELEQMVAPMNVAFVARLKELGIPVEVDAYGAGTHEWPYFQRAVHRSLPMLVAALRAAR